MPLTVQPIPGEPALFVWSTSATLVVADLHIGIRRELYRSGINIPSQTKKMFGRLLKLIADHSPDRIVLFGDVKHTCSVHISAGASANSRSFSRAYPEICQWASLPATMTAASGNIRVRRPRFIRQQVSCSMVSDMCTDMPGQTRRCSKRNT